MILKKVVLDLLEKSISEVIGELFFGEFWNPIDRWYSLISFPGAENEWNVPSESWHADEPIVVGDKLPWSYFVFIFLDDVERNLGPTVAIKGSHRCGQLLADIKATINPPLIHAFSSVNSEVISNSKNTRLLSPVDIFESLAEEDKWFEELRSGGEADSRIKKFVDSSYLYNGISVSVTELTGKAGDIIILDPRCLHSFSPNISNLPRQILRLDYKRMAFSEPTLGEVSD